MIFTLGYHLFNEKTVDLPNSTHLVHIINILYVFSICHRRKSGRRYIKHKQLPAWRVSLREALFVDIIR